MDWWNHIGSLKGQRMNALGQGPPFDVLNVQDQAVIMRVLSTRYERRVGRDEIEGALEDLINRGEMSLVEIRRNGHSERNPAYVAAILASLPGVTYTVHPIHLRYKHPAG